MPKQSLMLLAGDLVALTLFVLGGLGTHQELAEAGALQRFLLNAGPLALVWVAAGWALGAFRVVPLPPARTLLGRSLAAWLIAAPLALLLRALLLRAATIVVIFMLVTLLTGGILLLVWRAAFFWLASRRQRTQT